LRWSLNPALPANKLAKARIVVGQPTCELPRKSKPRGWPNAAKQCAMPGRKVRL
jgi:hypothetical protein